MRTSITPAGCRGWSPSGFSGPIHCTGGTADLCKLVLPDAAHLQEEDAKFANQRGFSKHSPALPLYTKEDAAEALVAAEGAPVLEEDRRRFRHRRRVHQRRPSAWLVVRARAPLRMALAGESCSAAISGATAVPSCRTRRPASSATCCWSNRPTAIAFTPTKTTARLLAQIISSTFARRGKVIIPAFAIGRVEELLYWLFKLEDAQAPAADADLRRQPDGDQGHRRTTRRAPTSSTRASSSSAATCSASPPSTRRRTRWRWSRTTRPASSSPRAAWPPAAASCTTCSPGCRIRATPCCSWAFRARAPAAGN